MTKQGRGTGAAPGGLQLLSGTLAAPASAAGADPAAPAGRYPGSGRLIARGKFLFLNDEKFFARGVTYGPFAPNSRGERFPEPPRAVADFALMRELGANVVRTYLVPPAWWLDLAAQAGLRVMAGIPWPSYTMVLDSPATAREIRRTIAQAVRAMRPWRDAIFAYSLGNEIRADVLRYHGPRRVGRFVRELYDLGKNADAEGLFTYANYPSAAYLETGFLDLICFNLFLHREDDFRRYLDHLMGVCGPLPLVLSEAGADTIREGEAFQAALLRSQIRVGFQMGLAGYLIFAFSDEWHTAGAEIRDWAFGLVNRDRARKPAFALVAEAFHASLPPPLCAPPMVSIVVAAYDAERTLGACLASLRRLNYPRYEIVVVDDGSGDATAAIARSFGVRLLSPGHRGLGAARNCGIGAARGEVIAFIDADAAADPDWLYHLVQALRDSGAAAAGGPNFAPPADSPIKTAIAAAPGQPREVPGGAARLAQLCGCNMAILKSALDAVGGFDRDFDAAGDDVDLSWRLAQNRLAIAAAPAAVVIHERRATIRKYLAQQIGYGRGEALLAVKHRARRRPAADRGNRLRGLIPWRPRIYYGRYGRGLFQTIYPARGIEESITLEAAWIAAIVGLLCSRHPLLSLLGLAAALATVASASCYALRAPLARQQDGWRVRGIIMLLALLGPIVRSAVRLERRVALAFVRP